MTKKIESLKTSTVLFSMILGLLVLAVLATAEGSDEVISDDMMAIAGMPQLPAHVGPPRLECPAPNTGVVGAQAPATSTGAELGEVVRLMEVMQEKRCAIEAERATDLQAATKVYREDLKAIAPKDMFESESEYHTRSAREKSEVELERVASINQVHRNYDDRLRQDVEPLIRRVEELLSSDDIVPRDAIQFHLETYDAESQRFHGILKIDSPIVPTDALLHFPMKRVDARGFWGNRQSLVPQVRVSLDLWSLTIELTRFGLADPESGLTTKVLVVPHPPVSRPPVGKSGMVSGFKKSAEQLANRDPGYYSYPESRAKGFVAEYNRLVQEAKGVFVDDAFVQSLQVIEHWDSDHAPWSVARAAEGLDAYLKSFVPSDGFMVVAGGMAAADPGYYSYPESRAKGFVAEYNRLVQEAKGVFVDDAFVQSLQVIEHWDSDHAPWSVARAAEGLDAYLKSFVPSDGFMVVAGGMAAADPGYYSYPESRAKGFVAEYNRLVQEAKGVFVDDAFVQSLQVIEHWDSDHAPWSVARAAEGLDAYLKSFVPSDGFMVVAGGMAAADPGYYSYPESRAKGFVAEYNRLIQEAKGVFVDDTSIQTLRPIEPQGSHRQAASEVVTAASGLERLVANISDVPLALEIKREPIGNEFDYLPYSGRFSEGARTLESHLRRRFSTSATNEYGNTDLHLAASRSLPGLASALLDAGADPRARNNWGATPLHYAYRAIIIATDIISRRAAIDAETDGGWTPLHYAAWSDDRVQVAELLIGQGADVHARGGDDGWTPLDRAIDREAPKLIELLGRHGASCNVEC